MTRFALAVAGVLLLGAASAAELSVPVTVAEPAGVERKSEPASGGVPFKRGQVKSVEELALFDKDGKAIPAQFSKLAAYEDGSVQWALADFLVDLPAGGKAEFAVKSGKAALPAKPLEISETADKVMVDTGTLKFAVNKQKFDLLESVEFGGRKVAGSGAVEMLNCELEPAKPGKPGAWAPQVVKEGGKTFPCKAGKPAKVSWEYKGPVRATLRVDGDYEGEGGAPLCYTVRITAWAGSGAVRLEHSIRNSNPKEGADAGIREATLGLKLNLKGAEQGQGPGWLALGGDEASLLVSHQHTGGCFPGGKNAPQKVESGGEGLTIWVVPERKAAKEPAPADAPAQEPPKGKKKKDPSGAEMAGYGPSFFALADCAHKDSQVWLYFHKGALDAAAAGKRHQGFVSRLHALADGAWVSETGCMGYGRFGTLQDEMDTYKKWGWQGWDDPKKQAQAHRAHDPNAYVDHMDVHDESEADSAELGLLMYLRTGDRGWFDLGEAYARYYKTHLILRTDGFEYDGFRHERQGPSQKSKRPCKGLNFGWYDPKFADCGIGGWNDSRMHMCHFWGNGAFDHYCLTGDVDSLEAGLDMAEYAALTYSDAVPGKWGLSLGRAWARQFQCVTRAYELTREKKWKDATEFYGQWAVKAPNRHACGLFCSPGGSYTPYFIKDYLTPKGPDAILAEYGLTYKLEHGELVFTNKAGKSWKWWDSAQSFEFEACHSAIFRYAEVMDNQEAKKLVLDLCRGARDMYWSKKCEQAIPHPYIGFPEEDKTIDGGVTDPAHKNCPGDNGGKHSGYHTRFFTDVFIRGYILTGEKEWLELSKKAWNRGSKRGYWVTSQGFPDDVVATFVGHDAPKGDHVDIRNSLRMFYEAPRAK